MKYKETHEKQFPPKGEILKQRWNDYQNQNKLLADNKKAAAAKAAEEKLEQTKTGATVEEIKTEETKEPAEVFDSGSSVESGEEELDELEFLEASLATH